MKRLTVKSSLLTAGITLTLAVSGFSQVRFEKHEVAKPFTRSAGLGLADVDQDGDPDILAGSGTKGLYWYENRGGSPVTWMAHTVDANALGCLSVVASDVDQDGLTDLVGGAWDDNSVNWYRNTGNQKWEKIVISGQVGQVHEVYAHDMDSDGLPDILAAGVAGNEIVWFHNPGNTTSAWPRQQLTGSFGGARSVTGGDLDGDGRADIVAAAFSGNRITIWKNMGGTPVVWQSTDLISDYGGAHRVQIADVNLDGKPDVIGWAYVLGALRWWENTGANFSAWTMHTVDNSLPYSCVGQAIDMDLDGDNDMVTTGFTNNQVAWYENTNGKATLWKKHMIDTSLPEPWMAYAGDIDGDLDIDVIAGGDGGNEIRWYENHPSGRMDTYIDYSGGRINTGIFLPDGYDERSEHELLIALPGAGDYKTAPMLRDFLIPVSEVRQTIIVSPDFPRAQAPDYKLNIPNQVNELIRYAQTRFAIDTAKIYLIGAGCQGMAVLEGTLSGYPVKGGVAINPEFSQFDQGDWKPGSKPLVIASNQTDPFYPAVRNAAGQLWHAGFNIKLLTTDGNASEYLNEQLADLTIRCMNRIDSAAFLTHSDNPFEKGQTATEICMAGNGSEQVIRLSGVNGDQVTLQLLDLSGRKLRTCFSGQISESGVQIPVHSDGFPLPGVYLLVASGLQGGTSAKKIVVF